MDYFKALKIASVVPKEWFTIISNTSFFAMENQLEIIIIYYVSSQKLANFFHFTT